MENQNRTAETVNAAADAVIETSAHAHIDVSSINFNDPAAIEAINLDDTKLTHIKLNFDGGYYIVVMDEGIESFHSAMGPYFGEYTEDTLY